MNKILVKGILCVFFVSSLMGYSFGRGNPHGGNPDGGNQKNRGISKQKLPSHPQNHGKTVSEAARSGVHGQSLADIAKNKNRGVHPPPGQRQTGKKQRGR